VLADPTTELLRDRLRDLLVAPATVGFFGDEVQQARQLQNLAIRAAGEEGRILETGVLVFAEQLDAGCPLRWPILRRPGRAIVGRCRRRLWVQCVPPRRQRGRS